jgi:hypothetical protein
MPHPRPGVHAGVYQQLTAEDMLQLARAHRAWVSPSSATFENATFVSTGAGGGGAGGGIPPWDIVKTVVVVLPLLLPPPPIRYGPCRFAGVDA